MKAGGDKPVGMGLIIDFLARLFWRRRGENTQKLATSYSMSPERAKLLVKVLREKRSEGLDAWAEEDVIRRNFLATFGYQQSGAQLQKLEPEMINRLLQRAEWTSEEVAVAFSFMKEYVVTRGNELKFILKNIPIRYMTKEQKDFLKE
jgi:hypothetical protein